MTELEQQLEGSGIELSSKYQGEGAEGGWSFDRWEVTVARDGRTFTTSYRTGLGHRRYKRSNFSKVYDQERPGPNVYGDAAKPGPVPPKLPDVLHCLLSDAQSGHMSFDEFCGEFGYDTDSRKALATWEACVATEGPLRRVLGQDFDRLAGLEH